MSIPAQVGHVEKRQPTLDMIDETRFWGIEVHRVIADGGYGDTSALWLGLEERGLDYVVGISAMTTAQPGDAQPRTPAGDGFGMRASRPWLLELRWEICCTSAAGGRHSQSLKGRTRGLPW